MPEIRDWKWSDNNGSAQKPGSAKETTSQAAADEAESVPAKT